MSTIHEKNREANDPNLITLEEENYKYPQIEILSMVKSAQSQNGLKHSDYNRYRRYCSKRLKRIRKALKITHGRGKFSKRVVDETNVIEHKDPRILHLFLYNSERAWAYAMNLRQELSSKKNNENIRIRFQIKKKFHKALQWAQQLNSISQKFSENKSALESEAYSEYMNGIYQFEVERWENSLNSFMKARAIYDKLGKLSDSLQSVIYKEKIEQIEQSVRYCNHKLKRGNESLDQLVEDIRLTNDPALSAQMEKKLLNTNRESSIKTNSQLSYHGKTFTIKNEKTLIVIQKIDEIKKALLKLNKSQMVDENDDSQRMNTYIELFSLFDEANRLINKEKEENVTKYFFSNNKKAVESTQQLYVLMGHYFLSQKYEMTIERNLTLIQSAYSKFRSDIGYDNIWHCKKNIKSKTVFPQDIVKLYDNLLQIYKQLNEIEASNPDIKVIKKFELEENTYRALRCFFVACTHFSYGKMMEGYSLLVQYEQLCSQIENFQAANQLTIKETNTQLYVRFMDIKEQIAALKVRAHINILNQKYKDDDNLKKQLENMNLEGESKKSFSLLNLLRTKPVDTEAKLEENLEKTSLVEFPPSYSMLPSKPFFLDLVNYKGYNGLNYPSLKDKVKEEDKGVFRKVFGFFGK